MIWSHDRYARRYIPNRKVAFFTRDIISLIESYFFFHKKRNGLPAKCGHLMIMHYTVLIIGAVLKSLMASAVNSSMHRMSKSLDMKI